MDILRFINVTVYNKRMLTAVILTKNEEKSIGAVIRSVKWTDEIIVIDDGSTDNTVNIAKKMGVKVSIHNLDNNFANQRNYGLDKASGDWILFIDADEVVSPQLALEIRKALSTRDNPLQAYYVRRRDFFWGKEMKWGELRKAYKKGLIRLVRRESGQWRGNIHEVFKTNGSTGQLKSFINHHPHETIKEFLSHVNDYSTLRAGELQLSGKMSNFLEIMFLPLGKFIYTYFIRGGFRDGPSGFVYSFMMSFHSFLVRAKLYLKTH